MEKELRLVAAYLGLALCHAYLGDKVNANNTLLELLCIRYESGRVYKVARGFVNVINTRPGKIAMLALTPIDGLGVMTWVAGKIVKRAIVKPGDERAEELAKFQTAACELLKSALADVEGETKCASQIEEAGAELPMLEKYQRPRATKRRSRDATANTASA